MTKEFLGVAAVEDLFEIISENFVSKEEIEAREKSLASAISVGAALIAAAILKKDFEEIATENDISEIMTAYNWND